MTKKFWIIMTVLCILTIGAGNAVQIGSANQLKIGNSLEYGNLENFQSAFDKFTEDSNEKAIKTNEELSSKKQDNHIVINPVIGTTGENVKINASLINNESK